jgi:hypothetical protein
MQHNEWLGLILTLVLIVLWVEAHEGATSEPPFACAPDAGDRMLISQPRGSSARLCRHGTAGRLSDASSKYPAGRVP